MNNITKITESGMCVGCGGCSSCEHITFVTNISGFPAPVVDDACDNCGRCLNECIYNFDSEE